MNHGFSNDLEVFNYVAGQSACNFDVDKYFSE